MFKDAVLNEDGILDITAKELHENVSLVEVVDVRREDEFTGELGHIDQAQLITLETQFQDKIPTLNADKIYVFVCRSGVRSSKAALLAKEAGILKVFNLKGGMLAWNSSKLPKN